MHNIRFSPFSIAAFIQNEPGSATLPERKEIKRIIYDYRTDGLPKGTCCA